MSYRGIGARHAQRQGSQPKPKLLPVGSNTTWISDFVQMLEGLTSPLTLKSSLVLPLGETAQEREQKLRDLCRRGTLKMHRVSKADGSFDHYEWRVV